MKKPFATLLVITSLFSLGIIGCSKKDNSSPISEKTPDDIIYHTIKELKDLAPKTDGETSKERYYVKGKVKSIDNATYGSMTLIDDTGSISVYGTYSKDGEKRYNELEDKPFAGDDVILYANLKNFKNEIEINSGWIISITHNSVEVDESQYTIMNAETCRTSEKGSKVNITATVAAITYANGMKENGFVLVDASGSIYVYDNQIAPRLKKGNKIRILAEKDNFISSSEKSLASKYGYKGASQLVNPILLENDEKESEVDLSSATLTSIKDIIDTPVTLDITSKLYKATSYIEKKQGEGFVNYYLNDIDTKTSTYVYTQANGADFSWLDKYDKQLHDVYFIVINAKSTATGCNWRFLPISVVDQETVFDLKDAPKYLVKYHGLPQFENTYTADPSMEVVTSVNSEVLKITNGSLSYFSSDSNVCSFVTENDKLIFHTSNIGKATITVTGSLTGQNDYSQTLEILVKEPEVYTAVNVKSAIDQPVQNEGEVIYVEGVVGPSLVNQSGFYLVDDTGLIAVRMFDKTELDSLKQGQTVIVKGRKYLNEKNADPLPGYGQLCLTDCTIVENKQGNSAYSTKSFITDNTISDITSLDYNESNHTEEAYIVNGVIKGATGYGQVKVYDVNDSTKSIGLYASSAAQYSSWLENYFSTDDNIKSYQLEIAPCNWNSKTYFTACLLSITVDGEKIVNSVNFKK